MEKPSSAPGIVRFELNRSLSGMGHERFASVREAVGPTPSASLARELFATGKVAAVHVYGNMVTVDIEKGYDSSGLTDIVREMYRYWKPGVRPPEFDDLPADEPATRTATGIRRWPRRPRWCPPTCWSVPRPRASAGTPSRADPLAPWRIEQVFDSLTV